jgi:hypothetical protein
MHQKSVVLKGTTSEKRRSMYVDCASSPVAMVAFCGKDV